MLEAIRISRAAYPHRLPCGAFLQLFGGLAGAAAAKGATPVDRAGSSRTRPRYVRDMSRRSHPRRQGGLGGGGAAPRRRLLRWEDKGLPAARRHAQARGAAHRAARDGRHRAADGLPRPARAKGAYKATLRVTAAVQMAVRRWIARRRARIRWAAVLCVQRFCRGRLARLRTKTLRRDRGVVLVQSVQRGRAARRHFERQRGAAVTIQAVSRRKRASRVVKKAVEKARVKRSYEGQIAEARERLRAEAEEKASVEAEKARGRDTLSLARPPRPRHAVCVNASFAPPPGATRVGARAARGQGEQPRGGAQGAKDGARKGALAAARRAGEGAHYVARAGADSPRAASETHPLRHVRSDAL